MRTEATETTGKLELLPNPCTTKPCLPGMALAVVVEGVPHFLTRGGQFLMHSAYEMPSPGERVVVAGDVHQQQDVNGKDFKVIEVSEIKRG